MTRLDWSASYSYANRNVPDRRRYLINDALESGVMQLTGSNDISREWTKLDEHIVSAAVNDKHCFKFGSWRPLLKFGAYGEYRTRKYVTRDFIYNWNAADNTLPDGFRKNDIPEMLSDESYFDQTGFTCWKSSISVTTIRVTTRLEPDTSRPRFRSAN